VQAIKAGLLEIADIHVVSKCDRSDSHRTIADLKMMLKDQQARHGWRPTVIGLSSFSGEGFDGLVEALDRHRDSLNGAVGQARRRRIAAFRLAKTAETLALEQFRNLLAERVAGLVDGLAGRRDDPYSAARGMVMDFTGEEDV
jgi:LAO/AO transport system kinase